MGLSRPYGRYCKLCKNYKKHPCFVYVITDSRVDLTAEHVSHDLVPYIGITRSPFYRKEEHNRNPLYRTGAKSTKAGAPYWQLELVIGPFNYYGSECKLLWRKKSRKVLSRMAKGAYYGKKYGKTIYARDPALVDKIMGCYW